jgi:hypothetical protein
LYYMANIRYILVQCTAKWSIFDKTLFLAHEILWKMAVTIFLEFTKLIGDVFFTYKHLTLGMSGLYGGSLAVPNLPPK